MKLGKLLVFSPYYPPHMGGLESHAKEFNENIKVFFDEIIVFTPDIPTLGGNTQRDKNIKIIRFPAIEVVHNFPLPKFWNKKFWKLWTTIKEDQYNLVISRTRFFLTSLMAMFFSKKNKISWIHIEHGSDFVKLSNPFTSLIARLYDESIGRIIFKFSDCNVPISKAVDNFIEKFDNKPRTIITRGINIKEINTIKANKKILETYKDHIKFIFCGRLYKWKGVERSISLVKSLSKSKKKIVFLIVGDGEDYEKLKKQESEHVVFLGKKTREETISIMKCGDIYLHSSYPGGGLSTSLLEAMLCGCCPVATKNEGANEVIVSGRNGLLVDYDDLDKLKKIVQALIKNNQFKKCGTLASISIKKSFDWPNSIKKYINVCKNLLK